MQSQTERDAKIISLIQALLKTDAGKDLIGQALETQGHSLLEPGEVAHAPRTTESDLLRSILEGAPKMVAESLNEAGYSVLRQIEKTQFPIVTDPHRVAAAAEGVILDTETTGLEPDQDRIVQLAMLKFKFDEKGIISIGEFFDEYHDPGIPMSEEAIKVTGITPEMLNGRNITRDMITDFLGWQPEEGIFVAHNAAFDRKFCEADFKDCGFDTKPWHCSMAQVDWAARGLKAKNLELIVHNEGYSYNAHNAYSDVAATAFALNAKGPDGRTAFAEMYERGLHPALMIIAERAPYDFKDELKKSGYKWAADGAETGGIKAWFKVVPNTPDNIAREADLMRQCYGRDVSLPAWELDQTVLYSSRKPQARATFRTAEAKSAFDQIRMTAAIEDEAQQPSLL